MAFGRIFSPENFKDLVSDEQAIAIAKKADSLLEDSCYLVFGVFTASGEAIDFTSDKKHGDTHVALLLGPEQMAALAPIESSLKKEKLTESEELKAKAQYIKQLEAENRGLRSRTNEEK